MIFWLIVSLQTLSRSSFSRHFPTADPVFLPSQGFNVLLNGKKIGLVGVVHPEVLRNFEVTHPCSVIELDTAPLMEFA